MVFLAGWSQSTGAVARALLVNQAGQEEDAAFTPLGASLVGRAHMEGSVPPQAGSEGWKESLCAAGSVNSSGSAWVTPSTLLAVAFSMRPLLYLAEKHIFVHYFLLKSKSSIFLLF